MRQPSLMGKPFDQCSNDELREHILPAERRVELYEDSLPLAYAVEISVIYAKRLISERLG